VKNAGQLSPRVPRNLNGVLNAGAKKALNDDANIIIVKRLGTMKQTLKLDFELPTLNNMINDAKSINKKTGWSRYGIQKNQYTTLVGVQAKKQLKPIREFPVNITFKWFCKDKRKDKGNIRVGEKYITDGLVAAGIIPDDSWEYIGDFKDTFVVDKYNVGVHVVLKY
jgi:hypothetical protein